STRALSTGGANPEAITGPRYQTSSSNISSQTGTSARQTRPRQSFVVPWTPPVMVGRTRQPHSTGRQQPSDSSSKSHCTPVTSACDTAPSSPHSIRPPFTSTINYILLNKLNVQKPKPRKSTTPANVRPSTRLNPTGPNRASPAPVNSRPQHRPPPVASSQLSSPNRATRPIVTRINFLSGSNHKKGLFVLLDFSHPDLSTLSI